jgi:protein TonB
MRRALLTVCLSSIGWLLPAASPGATDDAPSIARALSMLREDPAQGAAMLATLAQMGEPRAQLLYGSMLVEGKQVQQNSALGLAYVKLAAASSDETFNRVLGEQARSAVTRYELLLPGSDILQAEQIAARMTDERNANGAATMQSAVAPYTNEKLLQTRPFVFGTEPVQLTVPPAVTQQLMRLGCAAENLGGCGAAPKPGAPGHCTGRLPKVDIEPSAVGPGAKTVPPYFPSAFRGGVNATVQLVGHIDSSGWVCSAIVVRSAGDQRLDAAALEAVRQWKFAPAQKDGAPSESLHQFAVTFQAR